MADISTVEFEKFEAPGCELDPETPVRGTYVSPQSETKVVFIPSPPSKSEVKINPRAGFVCVTRGGVDAGSGRLDELKAKAADAKEVYVIPVLREGREDALHDLHATYQWMFAHAKTVLNIRKFEIQVKADADCEDLAEAFVEYASDELGLSLDDPEEL